MMQPAVWKTVGAKPVVRWVIDLLRNHPLRNPCRTTHTVSSLEEASRSCPDPKKCAVDILYASWRSHGQSCIFEHALNHDFLEPCLEGWWRSIFIGVKLYLIKKGKCFFRKWTSGHSHRDTWRFLLRCTDLILGLRGLPQARQAWGSLRCWCQWCGWLDGHLCCLRDTSCRILRCILRGIIRSWEFVHDFPRRKILSTAESKLPNIGMSPSQFVAN